jgi:membrane protease YdiL (CAAX protease family)
MSPETPSDPPAVSPPTAATAPDPLAVWAVLAVVVFPYLAADLGPFLRAVVRQSYHDGLTSLTGALSLVAVVVLACRGTAVRAGDLGLVWPVRVSDVAVGVLLTVIVFVGYRAVRTAFTGSSWETELAHYREAAIRPVGLLSWAVVLVSTLAHAFAEEFVFRGYLVSRLLRLLDSRAWAVVVSSVAFGGTHLYQQAIGAAGATVFGVLMAVAFLHTGRLWPAVVAHSLYNLVPYLLSNHPEYIPFDDASPVTKAEW